MTNLSDALRVVVGRCNARRSHFPVNLPPHPCSFYMDCADWDLIHAALAQALEDSRRIDALEREIRDGGPIAIHNGEGISGARRGLGLANTNRTLREAIEQCCGLDAIAAQQKEAANGD